MQREGTIGAYVKLLVSPKFKKTLEDVSFNVGASGESWTAGGMQVTDVKEIDRGKYSHRVNKQHLDAHS